MVTREIIRPVGLPVPWPGFACAVKAGAWLFVSGQMATDYDRGRPAVVRGRPELPLHGEDVYIRESEWIFDRMGEILAAAGSRVDLVVRLDQFPTTRTVMNPYHVVRRERIPKPQPASTSVGVTRLLHPDCTIAVEAVAIGAGSGLSRAGITTDAIPAPIGGYTPAIRAGDFIFVAGQLPSDFERGIAPEASVNPVFWEGNVVDRQTRYVLDNIEKTLRAGGSSLKSVVKANVYLARIQDLPRMDRVWREFFKSEPPARSIIPGTAFGVEGSALEINVVAAAESGSTKKAVVDADDPVPRLHESAVVRAGDFVFLSGLVAADRNGLIDRARVEPSFLGIGPRRQMAYILSTADKLLQAAGSGITRAVRADVFLTDMDDLLAVSAEIRECWGDQAPAMTFAEVPPLYVPGCSILLDLWAVVG